jgi:hypothetical protein
MGLKNMKQPLPSASNRAADMSCFGDVVHFRCPETLPTAIKRAADKKMISASAYMRQAIVDRLARDGIDLNGGASHG